MNATSSIALGKGSDEERRALGGFERGWGSEVYALLGVNLFGEIEDVDILRLHELFLDAGGSEVDEIAGSG
jgi:hypothetical protein